MLKRVLLICSLLSLTHCESVCLHFRGDTVGQSLLPSGKYLFDTSTDFYPWPASLSSRIAQQVRDSTGNESLWSSAFAESTPPDIGIEHYPWPAQLSIRIAKQASASFGNRSTTTSTTTPSVDLAKRTAYLQYHYYQDPTSWLRSLHHQKSQARRKGKTAHCTGMSSCPCLTNGKIKYPPAL